MEKRKPNDLSPDQCLAVDTESLCKTARLRAAHGRPDRRPGPRPHYHEFSCPLERSARKGISLRDLMLTESCPPGAQQYTNHREVSIYAKNQKKTTKGRNLTAR